MKKEKTLEEIREKNKNKEANRKARRLKFKFIKFLLKRNK